MLAKVIAGHFNLSERQVRYHAWKLGLIKRKVPAGKADIVHLYISPALNDRVGRLAGQAKQSKSKFIISLINQALEASTCTAQPQNNPTSSPSQRIHPPIS